MTTGKVLLLALLALQAGGDLSLSKGVPAILPSLEGWERVDGEAEFADPELSIRYEFYVRPERQAAYEVVRYRFAGKAAREYGYDERLQWDVDGHRLHRFLCRAAEPPKGDACTWRELPGDSAAFQKETGVLLWLYGLHRRLLEDRDAAIPPPPVG